MASDRKCRVCALPLELQRAALRQVLVNGRSYRYAISTELNPYLRRHSQGERIAYGTFYNHVRNHITDEDLIAIGLADSEEYDENEFSSLTIDLFTDKAVSYDRTISTLRSIDRQIAVVNQMLDRGKKAFMFDMHDFESNDVYSIASAIRGTVGDNYGKLSELRRKLIEDRSSLIAQTDRMIPPRDVLVAALRYVLDRFRHTLRDVYEEHILRLQENFQKAFGESTDEGRRALQLLDAYRSNLEAEMDRSFGRLVERLSGVLQKASEETLVDSAQDQDRQRVIGDVDT